MVQDITDDIREDTEGGTGDNEENAIRNISMMCKICELSFSKGRCGISC